MSTMDFEQINHAKVDLSYIYHSNDPRSYFKKLSNLNYCIAESVKNIYNNLIASIIKEQSKIKILDIGCSYGVNAALLAYGLSMRTLYGWWLSEEALKLNTSALMARDLAFLHSCGKDPRITFIGLDASNEAIEYARNVGLLDDGIAINLEKEEITEQAFELLKDVDLIISTGCVGYVTERTFKKILLCLGEKHRPWIGTTVLRMFPYNTIARTLSEFEYSTQKIKNTVFLQRYFESIDERNNVLLTLDALGLDGTQEARRNALLAEFFLSRRSIDLSRDCLDPIHLVDL